METLGHRNSPTRPRPAPARCSRSQSQHCQDTLSYLLDSKEQEIAEYRQIFISSFPVADAIEPHPSTPNLNSNKVEIPSPICMILKHRNSPNCHKCTFLKYSFQRKTPPNRDRDPLTADLADVDPSTSLRGGVRSNPLTLGRPFGLN